MALTHIKLVKILAEFDWHNFGLDEVEDAELDWADALAEQILEASRG